MLPGDLATAAPIFMLLLATVEMLWDVKHKTLVKICLLTWRVLAEPVTIFMVFAIQKYQDTTLYSRLYNCIILNCGGAKEQ